MNFILLSYIFAVICLKVTESAVYPVPGSYYSLLLRYNRKHKVRKEPRIARDPLRLWAFFDPPAALGSLSLNSLRNRIERNTRKTNKPNFTNTAREYEKMKFQQVQPKFRYIGIDKANISDTPDDLQKKDIVRESGIQTYKKISSNMINSSEGTCGGAYKINMDDNFKTDDKGRIFYQEIKSIGFPHEYERNSNCTWTIDIGPQCQMGMISYQIKTGNILPSAHCADDWLAVSFNNNKSERLCGPLTGHSSSYKWTKSGKRSLVFNFRSSSKQKALYRSLGFNINLSGYCWVYSRNYHIKNYTMNKMRRQS